MDCKIDAILIVENREELKKNYENDICYYFDAEWPNASWMEWQDGYIALDCGEAKVYYIIFK